ncbi:MAG TPA: ABC transporter permease [Gemmatimonadaceae bacterium]|nr:ABC transporter permease [Gemmatimonadaceae bacterium]
MHRPTSEFPVVARAGVEMIRPMARIGSAFFGGIGVRVMFLRDIFRAFREPSTWGPLVVPQMRAIGVDSLPLAAMVAAFIGGVIALQVRYQLFPGIQLSVVGLSARQMVVLELGPLLTGLVLTGRVGARMTAEIGTMRVTEQIDALETLAYDPVAYLVVPRLIAGIVMLPLLVIMANAVGVASGLVTALLATDVTMPVFKEGVRLGFTEFQVWYSLIKATMFGAAIAFLCTFEGYTTEAGAEGVGRSTASAVVLTSVAILILDALTALFLAPYLAP